MKVIRVPCGRLLATTLPPCKVTTLDTRARPRPIPLKLDSVDASRLKRVSLASNLLLSARLIRCALAKCDTCHTQTCHATRLKNLDPHPCHTNWPKAFTFLALFHAPRMQPCFMASPSTCPITSRLEHVLALQPSLMILPRIYTLALQACLRTS